MVKTVAKLLGGAIVVLLTVIGTISFIQENIKHSSRLISYSSSSNNSSTEETETETEITSLNINGRTYTATLPNEVAADPEEVEETDELKQAGQEFISTRELSPESPSTLDLAAIQAGDYNSILGNWGNETGFLLQFSKEGISLPSGLTLSDYNIGEANELIATVTSTSGISFYIRFYPAGVQIPASSLALTTEDPTDVNRDRIIVTRINRLDFDSTTSLVSRVYYRLETTTEETSATEVLSETETTESKEPSQTEETPVEESSEVVEDSPTSSSEPQETVYTSSYQAPETGGVTALLE